MQFDSCLCLVNSMVAEVRIKIPAPLKRKQEVKKQSMKKRKKIKETRCKEAKREINKKQRNKK